jgi:hypothetical protein
MSERKTSDGVQLFNLMNMNSSAAVLSESLAILKMIRPDMKTETTASAFNMTVALYKGNWPRYQACNTGFHDLLHSTDTFLAMARLLHGAFLEGENFTERQIVLALITAILHDAGYIQEKSDNDGTGAKYTANHVRRSMDFLKLHGGKYGLSDEEVIAGRAIILCTDLAVDINTISFPSPKSEFLGKMLGTADLLAQMSDRTYLEKLIYLYHEFREANVGGYKNEVDLLQKTAAFYEFIADRFNQALDNTDRFMYAHFVTRWNIQTDLYQESIQKQKNYLLQILADPTSELRKRLRRNRIKKKIQK